MNQLNSYFEVIHKTHGFRQLLELVLVTIRDPKSIIGTCFD